MGMSPLELGTLGAQNQIDVKEIYCLVHFLSMKSIPTISHNDHYVFDIF